MKLTKKIVKSAFCFSLLVSTLTTAWAKTEQPNIVLVVSDDQGIGDFGYNHNPIIKTPNLDELANESVHLTNFHVDPTCSPTRAALLTGKHSLKAGVWHTILGRYMLGPEHTTLAEALKTKGYQTAIFGKWHLGDNYPYRPQDQGFDHVLIHGGGGVGQTPDYWGNTQFDDTYYRNGKAEKFEGYATKIWFDETIKFIKQKHEKPYFAYLALNAPHGPYRAPKKYVEAYENMGLYNDVASFYAMITYIDEQVARLRSVLETTEQADNTVFIYMTDNGSSYRSKKWADELTEKDKKIADKFPSWQPNAGYSGFKGEIHEGGHRVPIFINYPNGQFTNQRINILTAHYDLFPTLLELAGGQADDSLDGKSLVKLFKQGQDTRLTDRQLIVTNQRVDQPSFNRPLMIAKGQWRYLRFSENKQALFNLADDPKQLTDVSKQHPKLVQGFQAELKDWWQQVSKAGFVDRYIHVGHPAENPVRLNAMDWMEVPDKQPVPWFIGHQPAALEYDYIHWLTQEDKYQPLPWYINVEQAQTYRARAYFHDQPAGTPIQKKYCVIETQDNKYIEPIYGRAAYCQAMIKLKAGKQTIRAWFTNDKSGQTEEKAAFYLYIKQEQN